MVLDRKAKRYCVRRTSTVKTCYDFFLRSSLWYVRTVWLICNIVYHWLKIKIHRIHFEWIQWNGFARSTRTRIGEEPNTLKSVFEIENRRVRVTFRFILKCTRLPIGPGWKNRFSMRISRRQLTRTRRAHGESYDIIFFTLSLAARIVVTCFFFFVNFPELEYRPDYFYPSLPSNPTGPRAYRFAKNYTRPRVYLFTTRKPQCYGWRFIDNADREHRFDTL